MKDPCTSVFRFEDLVGPKGGGCKINQEKTVNDLALLLGYDLKPNEISEISDLLFGDTNSFRRGQIGEWREYFSPYHKHLFKQYFGSRLIEMGYEKDNSW